MMIPFLSTRTFAALCAGASLLISACADMSAVGGTSQYGCKAPPGVQCDSVSGNYYNAIQNNLPSQRQRRKTDTEGGAADMTPRNAYPSPAVRPIVRAPSIDHINTDNASSATATAFPLRSEARVLRLWFKPWEDTDHDLYDQGYVYVTIDNGRWLIDHARERIRDAYAPIRPPVAAASQFVPQGAIDTVKTSNSNFFSAGPNTQRSIDTAPTGGPGQNSSSSQ